MSYIATANEKNIYKMEKKKTSYIADPSKKENAINSVMEYFKVPKFWDTKDFAEIILKLEKRDFTIE